MDSVSTFIVHNSDAACLLPKPRTSLPGITSIWRVLGAQVLMGCRLAGIGALSVPPHVLCSSTECWRHTLAIGFCKFFGGCGKGQGEGRCWILRVWTGEHQRATPLERERPLQPFNVGGIRLPLVPCEVCPLRPAWQVTDMVEGESQQKPWQLHSMFMSVG